MIEAEVGVWGGQGGGSTTTRTPRVLAVDDRPENLLALRAILKGLPIEVVVAGSGEEALKRLLVEDYAVILLDALMPGMDGFETAGHIKGRPRTRYIPIVFLTAADTDPHLAFRSYQAGAVDHITKPFDPWILRAKVSVFVDLWTLHVTLAERAAERDRLRAAIDDAAPLLAAAAAGIGAERPELADTLARARERLGSAPTGTRDE